VYFAGTLYWVVNVMAEHGGLAVWVAVLICIGLVAVMASFVAVFAVIVRRLCLAGKSQALLAAPLVWVATSRTNLSLQQVPLGAAATAVSAADRPARSVLGVYGCRRWS
jgi:apolipoprotein N-acyltransferase